MNLIIQKLSHGIANPSLLRLSGFFIFIFANYHQSNFAVKNPEFSQPVWQGTFKEKYDYQMIDQEHKNVKINY